MAKSKSGGISSVCWLWQGVQSQAHLNHFLNLNFVCPSPTRDCLLDLVRGVLNHLTARERGLGELVAEALLGHHVQELRPLQLTDVVERADQIVEIVAVIATFGFLNRWNDTVATQLEDEPLRGLGPDAGDRGEGLGVSGAQGGRQLGDLRVFRVGQDVRQLLEVSRAQVVTLFL